MAQRLIPSARFLNHGATVCLDHFGASGKGADVMAHFGFTADNIVQQLRELLEV